MQKLGRVRTRPLCSRTPVPDYRARKSPWRMDVGSLRGTIRGHRHRELIDPSSVGPLSTNTGPHALSQQTTAMPLRNQHGVYVNPADPDLISKVAAVLAPHGGELFVTPDKADDALTKLLVKSGRIWPQRVCRATNAEWNACHDISADIHSQDPARYTHVYGYALSASDGMWRTHSWV